MDSHAATQIAIIVTLKPAGFRECEHFDSECAMVLTSGEAAKKVTTLAAVSYCPKSDQGVHTLVRSIPNLMNLLVSLKDTRLIDGNYPRLGLDKAMTEFGSVSIFSRPSLQIRLDFEISFSISDFNLRVMLCMF